MRLVVAVYQKNISSNFANVFRVFVSQFPIPTRPNLHPMGTFPKNHRNRTRHGASTIVQRNSVNDIYTHTEHVVNGY